MIACDLGRAGLIAAMVLPGIPITALVGLLFLVTLIGAPFTSARAALYPTSWSATVTSWAPPSRSPLCSSPRCWAR
jgi:hypothetical protein